MFELTLLFANVLLPTLLCIVLLGLTLFARKSRDIALADASEPASRDSSTTNNSARSWNFTAAVVGSLAAVLAIGVAFGYRNGAMLWPEDAWARVPLATAIVALAGMLTELAPKFLKWLIRVSVLYFATAIVFPEGEGWESLQAEQPYWHAVITIGTFAAWSTVERWDPRRIGVISLCWIASMIAAAFLASQSFMKVTEPLLAVSSVLGCCGIAAICFRLGTVASAAAGPCLFAMSAFVASAQFNSYLGLSNLLSWLVILSPALVAFAGEATISSRHASDSMNEFDRTSVKRFMIVAVVVAILLAAIAISWTQLSAGGADEW